MENLLIGSKSATAKAEFDARKGQIADMNPDVYEALYGPNPTQQVVDSIIMAAKSVSEKASFSDLFKSDDSIAVGLASLANGKPPTDEFFLLTHIAFQYAVASGTLSANVAAADYGLIPAAVRNGTVEITQNKRVLLPEQVMERFYSAEHYEAVGDTNPAAGTPAVYTMKVTGNVGLVTLSNPKWIIPDRQLKIDMNFAATLAVNASLKVLLFGVKNVRV